MARTRYRVATEALPFRELPAAAVRAVLREGYRWRDAARDVLAGIVVGVVALPLAMALAVAVGVPPQHGLYTAIVGGFVVAALGGSRTQVTGPTAAFVVVLAPLYSRFGLAGLLIAGLLGGLILIALGVFRLGRLIQFVPHPVTTGFTAGIATVIAILQIEDLLGLTLPRHPESVVERLFVLIEARGTMRPAELLVGGATLCALILVPRVTRRVPAPLVALPLGAVFAAVLARTHPDVGVSTIASRFHTIIDGRIVDGIVAGPPSPLLPWHAAGAGGQVFHLDFDGFRALLVGGFAIAMLGGIESLLSAVVADGMASTRHDPDAELLALGIGNVLVPLLGGIPATGAIARTVTNIKAGARSPFAAMAHALTVLAGTLVLAPLLGYLPMASLAALLMVVAWNMSEAKHLLHTLRVAPRSDVAVLLTCYGLTVAFDMVVGVTVGMVLAALLFMRRMAEVTEAQVGDEHRQVVAGATIPAGVLLYQISGPLFFGVAQKAMAALQIVSPEIRVVVLSLGEVRAMDATGLVALESAVDSLWRGRRLAVLCDVRQQPLAVLRKAGFERRQGVTVCVDLAEALALAARRVDEEAAASKTARAALGR